MHSPSTSDRADDGDAGRASAAARDSLVRVFYGVLLLALLVVAVHGDAVHPLLAAALGVSLLVCWVGWPAYRESIQR